MSRFLLNFFREFFSILIRYSGIPFVIRMLVRNKVTILLYHAPHPVVLNRHLKYLTKKYNFIRLDDLIEAIHSKNWEYIPKNAMVMTIDDGHGSNFELLSVFKKYNVYPTIFVCTQLINTNRHFWFKIPNVNLKYLKKLSNNERLKYLKDKFGFLQEKEYGADERQALTLEEITAMKDFVDFQSHSRFHPLLPSCSDQESLNEILQSKQELENLLGKSQKHFAYPNGDYSQREIEYLVKAGYVSARTINVGWNDLNTNPYALNVTGITDDASVNMMVAQTSGLTMYLSYLINGSFTGKSEQFKKVKS